MGSQCLKSVLNYSTAICLPPCQNNGICHIGGDDNATTVCACTNEWTGEHCEIRKNKHVHLNSYYVRKNNVCKINTSSVRSLIVGFVSTLQLYVNQNVSTVFVWDHRSVPVILVTMVTSVKMVCGNQ